MNLLSYISSQISAGLSYISHGLYHTTCYTTGYLCNKTPTEINTFYDNDLSCPFIFEQDMTPINRVNFLIIPPAEFEKIPRNERDYNDENKPQSDDKQFSDLGKSIEYPYNNSLTLPLPSYQDDAYRDRPSDGEFFEMSGAVYEDVPCSHAYFKDGVTIETTVEQGVCKFENYNILNREEITEDILREWKINKSWINQKNSSGYNGILFVNEKDGFVVLANRGTEFDQCFDAADALKNRIAADYEALTNSIKRLSSYRRSDSRSEQTSDTNYDTVGQVVNNIMWRVGGGFEYEALSSVASILYKSIKYLLSNDEAKNSCIGDLESDFSIPAKDITGKQVKFLREVVIPYINALLRENPDYKFFVTGHSLGGYLGQIVILECSKPDISGNKQSCLNASAVVIDSPGTHNVIVPNHKKDPFLDITVINSKFNPINMATEQYGDVFCLDCIPNNNGLQNQVNESATQSLGRFTDIMMFCWIGANTYHTRAFIRDSFNTEVTEVFQLEKNYFFRERHQNTMERLTYIFKRLLGAFNSEKASEIMGLKPEEFLTGIYTDPIFALSWLEKYGFDVAKCSNLASEHNDAISLAEAELVCRDIKNIYVSEFEISSYNPQSLDIRHISTPYRDHTQDYCHTISNVINGKDKIKNICAGTDTDMPKCSYNTLKHTMEVEQDYSAVNLRTNYHKCSEKHSEEFNKNGGLSWSGMVALEQYPVCEAIFNGAITFKDGIDDRGLNKCIDKTGVDQILHIAAIAGGQHVISTIIGYHSDVEVDGYAKLLTTTGLNGTDIVVEVTPIMYASTGGNRAKPGVAELLNHGAKINIYAKKVSGEILYPIKTAFDYAIDSNGDKILSELRSHIKKLPNEKEDLKTLFTDNNSSYYKKLLQEAIDSNNVNIVDEIFKSGVAVMNAKCAEHIEYVSELVASGWALDRARKNGNLEIEYETFKYQYGFSDTEEKSVEYVMTPDGDGVTEQEICKKKIGTKINANQYKTLLDVFNNEDIAVAIAIGHINKDEEFTENHDFNNYLQEELKIDIHGQASSNVYELLYKVVEDIPKNVFKDFEMISLYGFKNYGQDKLKIHKATIEFLRNQFKISDKGKELDSLTGKELRAEMKKYIDNSKSTLDGNLLTYVLSDNSDKPELYRNLREAVIKIGVQKFAEEDRSICGQDKDGCKPQYLGNLIGQMNSFIQDDIIKFTNSLKKGNKETQFTPEICDVGNGTVKIRHKDKVAFPPKFLQTIDLKETLDFIDVKYHKHKALIEILPSYLKNTVSLQLIISGDVSTLKNKFQIKKSKCPAKEDDFAQTVGWEEFAHTKDEAEVEQILKDCRAFNRELGNDKALSNWHLTTSRPTTPPNDLLIANEKISEAKSEIRDLCNPLPEHMMPTYDPTEW